MSAGRVVITGVGVTAPKTMTSRLYSGAGALDVATALVVRAA